MGTTERLTLHADDLHSTTARATIERVAAIWRAGGIVAFPTETVYGLGAHAFEVAAVERIFAAKQRPSWDPLIVHVLRDGGLLERVAAEVSPPARALMDAFWPGPLTLLLPRGREVPDAVTAGRALVGVREPRHPVARALLSAAGLPIAAPSANLFGRPSPTTAAHVLEDLDGRADAVVDGGPATHGLESTVVDASQRPMLVYRPGAVSLEALREAAGEVEMYIHAGLAEDTPQSLPSPGVTLRHYAPRAQLVLVDPGEFGGESGDEQEFFAFALFQAVARLKHAANAAGENGHLPARVGVMALEEFKDDVRLADVEFAWGRWSDLEVLGQRLFSGLRWLDAEGATHIVCPVPPNRGLGRALRDRLLKAARTAR